MTAKPVQIPRHTHFQVDPEYDECEFQDDGIGQWVKYDDHQAALSRVREMLEAKAKEWDNWADMHLDGEALTVANKCHFDLLTLAATLEPGAADVETPGGNQMIKRFTHDYADLVPDKAGDLMLYADHKERVERLEAALRPFAVFACGDGKPELGCDCHNCAAAAALSDDAGKAT